MYQTSEEYKNANLQSDRKFESNILIGNRILTNEDLISFTTEQSIQQDDTFTIGNTISSCLNLMFLHSDIETDDKDIVNLKLGLLVNEEYEYVPLGIYNISNIDTNDTTTTLLCYDNMIKFDIAYKENAENPTLYTVINRLSELTGVQFGGTLSNYTDYSLLSLENYSCREILGFIAGILGANAIINREGKFDFVSIVGKNSQLDIDYDRYYDYTKKNKNYILKRIVNTTDLEEISVGTVEENTSTLQLQNPLINEDILKDLYSKLNNLEFLPYSLNWSGDISIDLGDLISITDKKEATRVHPILSQSISYNGALNVTVGAQGETKTINETNSNTSEENEIIRVGKKVVQVQKDAGELYVVVYDEENQSSISLTEKMLEAISDTIQLTANNINLEGLVTANNNFKINLDGSIEAVNAKFKGSITGSDVTGSTIISTNPNDSNEYVKIVDGIVYTKSKNLMDGSGTYKEVVLGEGGLRIGKTQINEGILSSPKDAYIVTCGLDVRKSIKAENDIITNEGNIKAGNEVQIKSSRTSTWMRAIRHDEETECLIYGTINKKVLLESAQLNLKSNASLRLGCNNVEMQINESHAGIIHLTSYEGSSGTSYSFRPTVNDATYLGSSSYRWKTIYSVNSLSVSSDRNTKENIKYIQDDNINTLSDTSNITLDGLYNFVKNDLFLTTFNYKENNKPTLGFIAQDMLQAGVYSDESYEIANTIIEVDEENNLSYDTGAYINTLAGALKKAILKIEKLEEVINARN